MLHNASPARQRPPCRVEIKESYGARALGCVEIGKRPSASRPPKAETTLCFSTYMERFKNQPDRPAIRIVSGGHLSSAAR